LMVASRARHILCHREPASEVIDAASHQRTWRLVQRLAMSNFLTVQVKLRYRGLREAVPDDETIECWS
jgi:hypothetical protein